MGTIRKRDDYKGTGSLWNRLEKHWQHDVEIIQYVNSDGEPVDFTLECNDCNAVILSAEYYDLKYIDEE